MLEKIQQKFSRNKMMQQTKSTVLLQQKKSTNTKKPGSRRQLSSSEILQKFKDSQLAARKQKAEKSENSGDNTPEDGEGGQSGYAMVEMLLVMMLFMLIGITIFTLIFAGSKTYNRLNENKNTQSEARIAMSYLNVKMRQNDAEGRVGIVQRPGTSDMAIRIKSPDLGDDWTTWIFWEDGYIWESQIEDTLDPSPTNGFEIVQVDAFDISADMENNSVTSVITYTHNDIPRTLSHTIRLHAGLQGGS